MKQFIIVVSILCFYISSFAQETWVVDNPHSNLRFEVGWEDFSVRTGEFKTFKGSVETDSRDDLSNAIFEFVVDASSVDVIADRLAGHVKSDKFLEVEKFPEITFYSTGAKQTSDSTYISKGKLTIHGVEKDQDVAIWVKGFKATQKGDIFGLEVSLTVNRNDFGLDWGSPRLAENIKLVAYLLYKQKVEVSEEY